MISTAKADGMTVGGTIQDPMASVSQRLLKMKDIATTPNIGSERSNKRARIHHKLGAARAADRPGNYLVSEVAGTTHTLSAK